MHHSIKFCFFFLLLFLSCLCLSNVQHSVSAVKINQEITPGKTLYLKSIHEENPYHGNSKRYKYTKAFLGLQRKLNGSLGWFKAKLYNYKQQHEASVVQPKLESKDQSSTDLMNTDDYAHYNWDSHYTYSFYSHLWLTSDEIYFFHDGNITKDLEPDGDSAYNDWRSFWWMTYPYDYFEIDLASTKLSTGESANISWSIKDGTEFYNDYSAIDDDTNRDFHNFFYMFNVSENLLTGECDDTSQCDFQYLNEGAADSVYFLFLHNPNNYTVRVSGNIDPDQFDEEWAAVVALSLIHI